MVHTNQFLLMDIARRDIIAPGRDNPKTGIRIGIRGVVDATRASAMDNKQRTGRLLLHKRSYVGPTIHSTQRFTQFFFADFSNLTGGNGERYGATQGY
jgi:hypothetical protein